MKKKLILLAISCLLLPACATDSTTGKKTLDPDIRNALIDVAKSAVAGMAASEATSGKIDWNLVAQGALGQVYSTSSVAAANKAVAYMIPNDTKLTGVVQTAVGSVAAAAKSKGLNESSAILIGTTFLDNELSNLQAP